MAMKTLEQKLAAAQLKANRLRHEISERRRAAETRRKIVIGGTILSAMDDDDDLRRRVLDLLDRMVTRDIDREVIADLLEKPSSTPPSPAPEMPPHEADQQAAE